MKYFFFFLLLIPELLFCQQNVQREKYWIYRERIKNFVVSEDCQGCGIPSGGRGPGMIAWADSPWMIGAWIGTLAMEYKMLKDACSGPPPYPPHQDACDALEKTKEDLYYAIEAINQLDEQAEHVWGCPACNYSPCIADLNGFMLSENIDNNFPYINGTQNVDLLNESWVPPPDGWRAKCINSSFLAYQPSREASQDHLIGLYIGFMLVKANILDVNDSWNMKPFMDGETSFVKEVQNISDRIITYLNSHAWLYINKCTGDCVKGVTGDINPNPPNNCQSPSNETCGNPIECCSHGGAFVSPQAIGFAAVNYQIQKGSPREASSGGLFLSLISNSDYRIQWNGAIEPSIFIPEQSRLPIILAALGNTWKIHMIGAVIFGTSTKKVAKKIKKMSIENNWEHLILLHRLFYGLQYTTFGQPITIPYYYYECLLDAAPCRGFDGDVNTGVSTEWGCPDRLNHRGCTDVSVNSNNGLSYMFYFNLHNLVFMPHQAPNFIPLDIKNLAPLYVDKMNYIEYDKKNFMGISIIANNYTITSDPIEGQGRVTFAAKQGILLGDGFKVINGGYFHGYIDPTLQPMSCNQWGDDCSDLLKVIPIDTTDEEDDFDTLFVISDSIPDSTLRAINQNDSMFKQNTYKHFNFSIIPNPSSGTFTLMSEGALQSIEIRDVLGNIIFDKSINNQPVNIDIDISSHPRGIYFLKVQSGEKIYTEKIIIQ